MKPFANCLPIVLSAAVGMQNAACGIDVQSPSGPRPHEAATFVFMESRADVSPQATVKGGGPRDTYDFCAAYPPGTTGCALCGHEDFSLDPGQEQVTVVNLTQCAGDVSFGHFSVVEYIRGGSLVQSLSLRPGGDEYALSVRNATTGAGAPGAVVVDRTYTYFGDVPDPAVLEVTVRRDAASRGGRKTLAVVYSSWLPD
jgi:hypothetical protein